MFCLLTPMLASAVSIMECSIAHQIQKFQSSFLVTLKWSAENRSLVSFVVWCIFFYHSWKFQGKGLWLEWKWRMEFPHLDMDSNQEQSDPGRELWENLSNTMLCNCNTYSKEEKSQKKGGEKGERCSYTLKYLWKQMLVLILSAAWRLCHN